MKKYLLLTLCLILGTLTVQAQTVKYSSDGSKFFVADSNCISVYDALNYKKLWTSYEYPFWNLEKYITFSDDSQKLFLLVKSNEDRYEGVAAPIIINARTGRTLQRINLSTNHAVFSPSGTQIAYINNNNNIMLYDIARGRDVKSLYTFATMEDPNDYWTLEDGTVVGTKIGWSPSTQEIIGFTQDGKCIIVRGDKSFDEDEAFYVIDINTGSVLLEQNVKPYAITIYNKLLGRIMVSEDRDYENIKILDVANAQTLSKIKRNGFAYPRAYSENGKRIAITLNKYNEGSTISVWDAETGILLYNLQNTNEERSTSLHPDGSKLLALYEDGSVILWDISKPTAAYADLKTLAGTELY